MLSLVAAGPDTIDLSAAKAHLRVDGSEHDVRVAAILAAATAYIGEACGRCLTRSTWQLALASISGDLRLPMPPVGAVTAIAIYAPDGTDTALDVADYYLFSGDDIATIRPKSGVWPATASREDAIRITFTAGYTAPPPELVHAVMLTLERDYDGITGAEADSYNRTIEALISSRRLGWVAA